MSTTLNTFDQLATNVRQSYNSYQKEPVQLSRVNKHRTHFECEGNRVSNTALKDLLNIFSVKANLINEIKDDEEQWQPLHNALSNIKQDRTITAIVDRRDGVNQIARFIDKSITESSPLNLDRGVELMRGYLEAQDTDLDIKNFSFNPETLQIDLRVQNKQNRIDVFEDGNDIWHGGFGISYGEAKTLAAPYYNRLICTNGMTAAHEIVQRYFQTRMLKQASFNSIIDDVVNRDTANICKANSKRLRNVNASLREFFGAKNILNSNKDLQKTYFDDAEIQEAYKQYGIRYKNKRWLSSANSNVNGYEFFNRLTHCATHQPDIAPSTRITLNALASELFFKGPDMAFQAPNPFINN